MSADVRWVCPVCKRYYSHPVWSALGRTCMDCFIKWANRKDPK